MSVIKLTDLDLKGKRVLIRADLNVPVKDGKVTSDARITRLHADLRALPQGRRQGDGDVPPRPSRPKANTPRKTRSSRWPTYLSQEARQAGAPDQGLDRRRLRGRRRRTGAAGKRALQQGREEERRRDRAEIRQAVRRVRDGRLRHRAPRRSLHPRRRQVRAGRLRRHPADRRTGRADQGAAQPGAPDGRHRRRLQGFDQADRARSAVREGRPAGGRRRHRQHLPRGHRQERRQVAVRGRPGSDRQGADGENDRARRDHPDRGGRGVSARNSTPTNPPC